MFREQASPKNTKTTRDYDKNQLQTHQPISHGYIELRKLLKQIKLEKKTISEQLIKTKQENQSLKRKISQLEQQVLNLLRKIQQNINQDEKEFEVKRIFSIQNNLKNKILNKLECCQLQKSIFLQKDIQKKSIKQLLKIQQVIGDTSDSNINSQKEESMLLSNCQVYLQNDKQEIQKRYHTNYDCDNIQDNRLKPMNRITFKKADQIPTKIQKYQQQERKLKQQINYLLESNSMLNTQIKKYKYQHHILVQQIIEKQKIIIDKRYQIGEITKELNQAKNILQYFNNNMNSTIPVFDSYFQSEPSEGVFQNELQNIDIIPTTINNNFMRPYNKCIKRESRNQIANEIHIKLKSVLQKKQNLTPIANKL